MVGPSKKSLRTRKRKSKTRRVSDAEQFCYTGIGARKSGNHTRKEFMKVIDKEFKRECSSFIKAFDCKSCIKLKKYNTKFKPYQLCGSKSEYYVKLIDKCYSCKHRNTKKCNLKENKKTKSGGRKNKKEMLRGFFTFR